MSEQPLRARPFIGTLALVCIVALTIFWVVMAATNWNTLRGSVFGWNLASDGTSLRYVTPGFPAAQAGIQAGDQVDWASLPLLGRANLGEDQVVPPDSILTLNVSRAGTSRTVRIESVAWSGLVLTATRVGLVAQIFLIGIGIALVRLRPSRMTWGFLLAWLGWPVQVFAKSDATQFLILNGFVAFLTGLAVAGLLMFISRFPKDDPRGVLVYLDRLAVPIGALVTVSWLALDVIVVFSSTAPPTWLLFLLTELLTPLITCVVLAALVVSYSHAAGEDRQRILPVLASFALLAVATTMLALYRFNFTGGFASYLVNFVIAAAQVLVAIAVVHGVVRNRVIDLSFAISRTLVYTVLTSILVGTFALIDFASAKLLEHLQIALLLEALAALAFGIWLKALHTRVEAFVDRTLFRTRHSAEARLLRTAKTLAYADSETFVDEALIIEACDALDLASAALFRNRDGSFARILDEGWSPTNATELPTDDHLIVNLRAELEPIDLLTVRWPQTNVPPALAQPILAIPLVVRHDLIAFVLYGGHKTGEAIDPDEQKTLVNLAHAAASAYEHIHARALLTESTTLRAENAMLVRERVLLRDIVDTLKR